MKYGAIDIGSNSVRHLVVDYKEEGLLLYRSSSSTITRITEGSSHGKLLLGEQPVERTCRAVGKILSQFREEGIPRENCFLFATESLRMATNSLEVRKKLESEGGIPLEVLSSDEEARSSLRGAAFSFGPNATVFDLGGGSLEISTGEYFSSYPLGAVRMTNRFGEEPQKIEKEIHNELGGRIPDLKGPLVGVGGTSSSVVMMQEGIPVDRYDPALVHGCIVTLESLEQLLSTFIDPQEDRNSITGLEPLRSDIIVAGISVIMALLKLFGVREYAHSETGILWGFLVDKLESKGLTVQGISLNWTSP